MGFKKSLEKFLATSDVSTCLCKNTVLLESTNGADVGNNMLRIMEELSKPENKKI